MDENPYETPRTFAAASKQTQGTRPPTALNWYLWFWLGPVVVAILISLAMMLLWAVRA